MFGHHIPDTDPMRCALPTPRLLDTSVFKADAPTPRRLVCVGLMLDLTTVIFMGGFPGKVFEGFIADLAWACRTGVVEAIATRKPLATPMPNTPPPCPLDLLIKPIAWRLA